MNREAMIAALIFGGSGSGGGSGAEVFVTTIVYNAGGNAYSANHSATEIQTAYAAGKLCYAVYTDSGGTFIYQFAGIKTNYAYFSRINKLSSNNAVITTFEVSNSGLEGYYNVTRSTSTLAPAPLIVNYTITGAAVDGTYPLSADATLAQMQAAKAAGREVRAKMEQLGESVEAPLVAYDGGTNVVFTAVATFAGIGYALYYIQTADAGGGESSFGRIIPLNTTVMSYNTSTDELSITNVPEVSS